MDLPPLRSSILSQPRISSVSQPRTSILFRPRSSIPSHQGHPEHHRISIRTPSQSSLISASRRIYRGRPENQRDPAAENQWDPAGANQWDPDETNQWEPDAAHQWEALAAIQNKNRRSSIKRNSFVERPSTSRSESRSESIYRSVSHESIAPSEVSLFSFNIAIRESTPRLTFSPSAAALIEISRQTYNEMITKDSHMAKVLLPEFFDYYSTAMLWLRIVSLKQKNSQPLSRDEQDLLTLTELSSFCVPEPVFLQLKELGRVVTVTEQNLYPEFPPLPNKVIGHNGGYYGKLELPGAGVDDTIHNLYEEIPCLGVLAEGVRQSVSDAPPGHYASVLNIDSNNLITSNLLGYRPLTGRRVEAKILAISQGIDPESFPDYPSYTAFNFEFIQAISHILKTTWTFTNNDVVFSRLSEDGGVSQTIISRPVIQNPGPNVRGETRTTSLYRGAPENYGSAVFFGAQLMKEPGLSKNHNTWCCVSFPSGPPHKWIENRNCRRNLPIQYMQQVFQGISLNAMAYRMNIIRELAGLRH